MSADQQTEPKRRSSRAARESGRRRRRRSRSTTTPTTATTPGDQEAGQAAELSRGEARRQAKAQAAKAGSSWRHRLSTERTEGLQRFIRETIAEIRKVVWPDAETTRNLTLLVIGLSIFLGILLGGIDFVLYQVFEAF